MGSYPGTTCARCGATTSLDPEIKASHEEYHIRLDELLTTLTAATKDLKRQLEYVKVMAINYGH